MTIGLRVLLAALAVLTAWPSGASAQTKLKWAHVYEVAEPYHTQAVWAGEEIKKRSNGKYQIDVFPASQLGNENQINWKLYRDSQLFRDIAKGYEDKTKHKVITLTYYGQRMVTANKEIKKPRT